MKIKTIKDTAPGCFDERVNRLLEDGWLLGKREWVPYTKERGSEVFYAELVLLDEVDKLLEEPAEPQPVDPLEALHDVRDFCDARTCAEDCQLYAFCNKHLPACEGPADWRLPGEEAAE